jgi:hypothetical protein
MIAHFRETVGLPSKDRPADPAIGLKQMPALAVGQALLQQVPQPGPVAWLVQRRLERDRLLFELGNMLVPLQQEGDFETLRGVLAAEAGDTVAARRHFRQALYDGANRGEPAREFGGRRAALRYLEMLDR